MGLNRGGYIFSSGEMELERTRMLTVTSSDRRMFPRKGPKCLAFQFFSSQRIWGGSKKSLWKRKGTWETIVRLQGPQLWVVEVIPAVGLHHLSPDNEGEESAKLPTAPPQMLSCISSLRTFPFPYGKTCFIFFFAEGPVSWIGSSLLMCLASCISFGMMVMCFCMDST